MNWYELGVEWKIPAIITALLATTLSMWVSVTESAIRGPRPLLIGAVLGTLANAVIGFILSIRDDSRSQRDGPGKGTRGSSYAGRIGCRRRTGDGGRAFGTVWMVARGSGRGSVHRREAELAELQEWYNSEVGCSVRVMVGASRCENSAGTSIDRE